VDAARRLGIPTIPGEEVLAPTADAARLEGANRNIFEGTASPLDGGRALRQQGLTDPAAVEGAGLLLGEGTTAGSAAIAGLPDAVFKAAEAGELPTGRAMAIGGSGLDGNGQMAALRFSRSKAGQALSDQEFAELMALSGPQGRPNPMAQVDEVKRQLDTTDAYYAGPVKVEVERFDNGGSRTMVEVATAGMLPPEFLAAKGVTDPSQLSSRRQVTLLREYTMQELRKLPPGDYALDALTDKHASIYSRWFDGGSVQGVTPATDSMLAGNSWIYRPQDDPKSLVSQGAMASAAPAPAARDFASQVGKARVAAAVRGQLPESLRSEFDQLKRQDGDVAQLLEQGSGEVATGSRLDVVANRIRRQVEQLSAGSAAPAEAVPGGAMAQAAPQAQGLMTAADRQDATAPAGHRQRRGAAFSPGSGVIA
jgi:hypothetical protein